MIVLQLLGWFSGVMKIFKNSIILVLEKAVSWWGPLMFMLRTFDQFLTGVGEGIIRGPLILMIWTMDQFLSGVGVALGDLC